MSLRAVTILARLKFTPGLPPLRPSLRQSLQLPQAQHRLEDAAMSDKREPIRGKLTMDGKLVARQDSYEIKSSQVKQRPPAPAPMVKTQAPISPPATTPTKSSK
jgi:hypothetical protein